MNKVKYKQRKLSTAKFSVLYVVVWGNTLYGYATNMKHLHSMLNEIVPLSYVKLTLDIKKNEGYLDYHGYKIYRIRP